ncbi:uncharacterized protein LOC135163965 [Diachasmimorpha longicaudata]|uniref:uncharacterized protein LOC135163965 n=1 Tax=Diachasmimorpha longicaudata TaxID=58733 RepID=UPI0030B8B1B7
MTAKKSKGDLKIMILNGIFQSDDCFLYKLCKFNPLHQFLRLFGDDRSSTITMKYFGIALLIVAFAAQALARNIPVERDLPAKTITARDFSSQLKNFLEVELRKSLKTGRPSQGIPIMDPFDKSSHDFAINQDVAKISGSFNNVRVHGCSAYKVDVVKVSIFTRKATVQLTFPALNATGKYSVKGVAMNTEIYGDGEFQAIARNLKVHAVVSFSIFRKLKAKSVKLNISLGSLEFKATGLYHDENISKIASQMISEKAPSFIAEHHNQITSYLSPLLLKAINKAT